MTKLVEIERIFLMAIDLPKKERIELIKNESRGDPELEREVLSIFKVEAESHSILDNVREAAAAVVGGPVPSEEFEPAVDTYELPLDVRRSILDTVHRAGQNDFACPVRLADYERHFVSYSKQPNAKLDRIGFYLLVADYVRQAFRQVAQRSTSERGVVSKSGTVNRNSDCQEGGCSDLLDEAIRCFEVEWSDHSKLFKLRHYLGLTLPDAAVVLEISESDAVEKWTFAKAWINSILAAKNPPIET